MEIDEELLEDLYSWVDQIPLSRPKREIRRDFADGVLVAEIVHNFVPGLVEIHNYPPSSGTQQKLTNWTTLNRKVFKKLGFEITDQVMKNICNSDPWAVEQFLMMLRRKLDRYVYEQKRLKDKPNDFDQRPEADRGYARQSQSQDIYAVHGQTNQAKMSPGRGVPKQPIRKADSLQEMNRGQATYNYRPPYEASPTKYKGGPELVPKIAVEEKEQEVLAKEETIQILQVKVRRLEHLLHLKDVRIDDLQERLNKLESQLRGQPRR